MAKRKQAGKLSNNLPEHLDSFLRESNKIESEYSHEAYVDSLKAWQFIINEDKLTVNNILDTHKILMQSLNPYIGGKMRDCDVLVGGRACPKWWTVPALLMSWVDLYGDIKTEDDIKKAHIAFEKIHPFEDGNGRTGRILLNWQRVKAGLPILVIHSGPEQMRYYTWFD